MFGRLSEHSGSRAFQAGMKSGLTSATTAGLLNTPIIETSGGSLQSINQLAGIDQLGSHLTGNFNAETLGRNLVGIGARGLVNAGVGQVVYGSEAGRFSDAFVASVTGDLAAMGANAVGQYAPKYSPQNVLGHAAVGAAAARLRGQDALAGAIGGASAAIVNPLLDQAIGGEAGSGWGADPVSASQAQSLTLQLASVATGAGIAAAAERDHLVAMGAAHNETINNYLTRENILDKQARLAAAKDAAERRATNQDFGRTSLKNDSELVGNAQAYFKEVGKLSAQREKYVNQLVGPLTEEATTRIKEQIVNIDRQIMQSGQNWLSQAMRDRQGLVALSEDTSQSEAIRQEARHNIKMIDRDIHYARILDEHFWTVALSAASLPLGGSMAPSTLTRVALSSGLGGGFYSLGQTIKGEPIRPAELIVNMATAGLGGSFATKFWWQNAFLGGSVNAANTWAANQIYGEDKNVIGSFWLGAAATGLGTGIKPYVTSGTARMISSLTGGTASTNPYLAPWMQKAPNLAGEIVEQTIPGLSSAINIKEEGGRK